MPRLRFLHLEDDALDGELAAESLRRDGIEAELRRVETREAFEAELKEGAFDLILSDYKLPSFDGVRALELARSLRPECPFIFVSGTIGEEIALEAVRHGATDYVLKERMSRLGPVVRRALQEAQEQQQRAQAEQDLRNSVAIQEALLEAARIAKVAPWSLQGGRLVMADSIREILGYDPIRQVRTLRDLEVFLHAEDRGLFRRALRQPTPALRSFECRMRHSDQGWVWTRWTLGADPEQGGVIQDITEQRQLQSQLLQSQKLESLGELAAGIAHDFKNLLQAVGGHADLLSMRGPLTDRQRESLAAIDQAIERGRALTAKLLAFSRDEPLRKSQVQLNQVIEEVGGLLRPSLALTTRLVLDPAPDLPPTQADSHQLHQVLMNLVLNAQAAMDGPGSITLRTGREALDSLRAQEVLRMPGDYLLLDVEDSGKGIPPDLLPRIFEPFFTTKGEQGTGLGLSVAYGIVESHGGWIDCQSEVGKGTRFRIHLPLVSHAASGQNGGRTPSGPHRAAR